MIWEYDISFYPTIHWYYSHYEICVNLDYEPEIYSFIDGPGGIFYIPKNWIFA